MVRLAILILLPGVALAAPHPLDDLSPDELKAAVAAVKKDGRFDRDLRFTVLMTREPAKADVLRHRAGGPVPPREALAEIYEPRRNRFSSVTIDLGRLAVKEVVERRGVQPPILLEEYRIATEVARKDPRFRAAMKKRGISDMKEVALDGWAPGLLSPAERAGGRRLMRVLAFHQGKRRNYYGRPIEGVIATIDMNRRKVVDLWDLGAHPLNRANEDLDEKSAGPPREAPRPLEIAMPKGPSFTRDGQALRWQGWSARLGFQPMKGLVLYEVAFDGRPVLYKGALSEMVVPYGDPARTWSFRNAFDVGEYGLGRSAHMLDPLLDVPAHATFLDAHFADDLGEPLTIPRAIAVYERDGGLLWKHTDMNTRDSDGRRARELVVTFTTTIGNYDYGVDWVFHQDGTLAVEVFLTGILLAKGTAAEKNPCDGECLRLVAPRILAPNHQHFFNFRLDLDVDGAADNTPVQADVAALPASADNPDRNAFDVTLTRLERESRAARDLSPATARKWKVVSTTRKNALGHPTGYALMTGETATPYLDAGSPIRRRARFLDHAVWFTRYHDAEQSAAGEYPNQAGGGEGLERFVADDEPLEGQDVVLWYTFGVTHVPRPEEWPIMNAHRAGFSLVPVHFFARNPALSVPAVPRGAIRDALRRPSP